MKKSVGVLIKAKSTNNIFLMLRNSNCSNPLTWSIISGGIEDGEEPLDALKREIYEECSIDPNIIEYKLVGEELNTDDSIFIFYEGYTNEEFKPKLNNENLEYIWSDINDLPEPLYPNLLSKITKMFI